MLRADVPVGSYLSGGLDSALIAALAQRFARGAFQTFSIRFEDAEYDETSFQRLIASQLGSEHHEVLVRRGDIARVFPDVVRHAERPILRTAPAPLFVLSRLVREHGLKVVLTGEGADEIFAGYDVFREGKVRRFWARAPHSATRPRLLERLYPYLVRSPVSQGALARQFFGRDLARYAEPGFAHATRWRTTSALKTLFSADFRQALASRDSVAGFLATLPTQFRSWEPLAQDQYIEVRTLLTGYLLASQGDRMLMAHSVEGRFPFLDKDVVALANSLPSRLKLRALTEKYVLKRASSELVDKRIVARAKQPYRAPDALSFSGADRPEYVDEMLEPLRVRQAGIFDPDAVSRLWAKCRSRSGSGAYSNSDNMALVGVLSTQLLHHQFVCGKSAVAEPLHPAVDIDAVLADSGHHRPSPATPSRL
jgi:asparagine synthase (glutamine-hydrolysing)